MKLIRQTSLYFQEGKADKVYEVDLCEVGSEQFVVNFRYGRRGRTLRDGTKTPAPVSLVAAERIYDDLVASKTKKGYRETGAAIATTGDASPPSADENPPDPRRAGVLKRLMDGHQSTSTWRLSRAVWRAGEMTLREAEPHLISLVGSGDAMLDYNIAAALSRVGSIASLPALRQIKSTKAHPYHVRRMAVEAILQITPPDQRAGVVGSFISQLPDSLQQLARNGPAADFQRELVGLLEVGGDEAFSALESIYFIDNEHVRPGLLHVLRSAPLQLNYFKRIRRILKTAEMRRDAQVYGILTHRIETTSANFTMQDAWYFDYHKREKPTVGPKATAAYSTQTRAFLRRRTWRTLDRLGQLNEDDYVRLAVGVLLPFTDEDARQVSSVYRWDVAARSYRDHFYDKFSSFWAFCQILFANSPRYQPDERQRFICLGQLDDPTPSVREEAFPHLWDKHPAALLHLLDESRCAPVHEFAARALRTCREFCQQLDLEVLKMLLGAPYEVTVELGFDLAVTRYDEANPDRALVLALANCVLLKARSQAHKWISSQRSSFFQDSDFTLALLTSPHQDTRQFAAESLRAVSLDKETIEALIARLVAFLQSLSDKDSQIAGDVSNAMLRLFAVQLRTIGPEVIRDLLAHPLSQLQAFAGELILAHQTLSKHPPTDILRSLINAEDPAVRGVGVRILGQLPDDVLKASIDLLVALNRHPLPDIRAESRPLVKRLADVDSRFGEQIALALIEALLIPGAPDGVPSHTARMLREDLFRHLRAVPSETVWKLLQSRSTPAQEIGGILLPTNVDAKSLGVAEMIKLASNDILAVREASWQMCRDGVDRLRAALSSTVRILDAKWADSRRFGIDLFRDHFQDGELTPAILVSICDSVREDVQQFGRELITKRFEEQHGQEYLLKLSEHPTVSLQMFATNFLQRFAGDEPDKIVQLEPYFVSVLSRVNKARVTKDRVLSFLSAEARKDRRVAEVVVRIMSRLSATCAIGDKARSLEIMWEIHQVYPDIELPLQVRGVEVR